MEAAQALADLTEISSQIQAAVLATSDGSLVASTLADERGKALAEGAAELVLRAEQVQGEGAESPIQLQAELAEGSVFVVRDGGHLVAAVTGPEPTVGLVFYDLKTCLRLVGEEEKPQPPRRQKKKKKEGEEEAEGGEA
jgi:predicted regulator of Ras-like GTPase activity (Roadblock/LC7/MglB family)